MLVTKEQQESWVNAYIKERHTIDGSKATSQIFAILVKDH